MVIMAAAAGLVAGICFAPVLAAYGFSFLHFSDEPMSVRDRCRLVAYGAIIGVWGIAGCMGLLAGLAGWIHAWKRKADVGRPVVVASLAAILLVLALFIRLPLEYGYLVPLAPFVILLGIAVCPPRWAWVALSLLLVAPFAGQVDPAGQVSLAGPVIVDARIKQRQLASLQAVYEEVGRRGGQELVIVAGREIDRFRAVLPDAVTVVQFATASDRGRLLSEGRTVLMLMKKGPYYTEALCFEPRPGGPPRVTSIPLSKHD